MNKSILFMIHCKQHTGYAIEKLEAVFQSAAEDAGYSQHEIHWSFSSVSEKTEQIHQLDFHSKNISKGLSEVLNNNNIDIILAFDLPFPTDVVLTAKAYGVKKVISYWGASMSAVNVGLKLLLKKAEHWLYQSKSSDLYIFESKAMQYTATNGRGIPFNRTCVIPLGVNIDQYFPSLDKTYIHECFNIPVNRKVVFYSGHMEERKGVRVIINAARELSKNNSIKNIHFVICGNKGNQADRYLEALEDSHALNHVTFAGYRNDIPDLMRSSHIGVIASTGWDSFTMSSVEMLASGLPLIVSNLQGLKETVVPGQCGEYIEPGDFCELAKKILNYLQKTDKYLEHSKAARQRAAKYFSKNTQVKRISEHIMLP